MTTTDRAGIEALNVYCGLARLSVPAAFAGRGLDPARLDNLMMDERSVALPFEDPVTHAVNAAKPLLDRLGGEVRDSIELLVTATESGLDYSKSVASYVHEHLGLSRRCRVVEAKQACYAATATVQLATSWVASRVSPGARALVIATDVSLVDERAAYAEPAMGTGAAAVLVGADPRVLCLDLGAVGIYSYETMDSARPGPTFDVADADRSLFAYLDCLSACVRDYLERVDGAVVTGTFDRLVMHTPFAGIVRAAHRKLMREFGGGTDPAAVEEDFASRVLPSLAYPRVVGNLCSGSVYLGLASLLDDAPVEDDLRVGLFSYGSGCASEFFSGLVGPQSAAEVGAMRIGDRLAGRAELTFDDYVELLAENRSCLQPERHKDVDVARWERVVSRAAAVGDLLVHVGTRDHHRQYGWLPTGAVDAAALAVTAGSAR